MSMMHLAMLGDDYGETPFLGNAFTDFLANPTVTDTLKTLAQQSPEIIRAIAGKPGTDPAIAAQLRNIADEKERNQMLLIAGGTLVAVAVILFISKKKKRR